jgi:hypothetical protein
MTTGADGIIHNVAPLVVGKTPPDRYETVEPKPTLNDLIGRMLAYGGVGLGRPARDDPDAARRRAKVHERNRRQRANRKAARGRSR